MGVSLEGVVAQTSPAGPVGATVDVATSAAALYPCSECGRAYSTASNLARHRQSHRSTNSHAAQRRSATPDGGSAAATSRKCPHCDKVS